MVTKETLKGSVIHREITFMMYTLKKINFKETYNTFLCLSV